jgi:hypothetical protein
MTNTDREPVAWRIRGPRGGWMHSDVRPASWKYAEPLYAAPSPTAPTVEEVARAIMEADDGFGYHATLSSLVDGVATYTLTMGETVETFTDNADANAVDQYQARTRQVRDERRAARIIELFEGKA